MENLNRRVFLITGGTRGIGAAIARRLASDGGQVVVSGRGSNPELEALLPASPSIHFLPADVRDPQAVRSLVQQVLDRHTRLDGLVCAAGFNLDRPFLSMTLAEWQAMLDVHLTGAFLSCQAAAPALIASRGAILTLASQTAFRGRANGANYCAAKAGVVALTKCIAHELAPHARANVLLPGLIETEEVVTRLHLDDPTQRTARLAAIPMARFGQPDDLAGLAAFLLSDAAAYITGQVLWVNGGMVMP